MPDFARSDHPAVRAQLERLSLLSPGGDRLGLDRITRLLDRLGRPQDSLPPVFHVAGTNGKGSTCAFLRAALEASGHTVHAFTSPHLVHFNERIRIAGKLIEDEALAALLTEVLNASEDVEPSFFEVTTAVAFLAFARTPADAAVIEVGLGGRLDATNVIERPVAAGIAALGIDHQQFLGQSLVQIAAEKAGIAVTVSKPNTSNAGAAGRFDKADFVYVAADDIYICPAGERLTYRMTSEHDGKMVRMYWTSACADCPVKHRCTTGKERRVRRWEHEAILERVQKRLDDDPSKIPLRSKTVEHPFGTIKAWMGATHFRMKTLKHVATEMALHVLAYNVTRVMAIMGVSKLIEAMRT